MVPCAPWPTTCRCESGGPTVHVPAVKRRKDCRMKPKPKPDDQESSLPLKPVVGALGAVVIVAFVAWYFLGNRQPPPAKEAVGRVVADKFLAELRAQRAGSAWDLTSAEFKSDEGRESFIRWAGARPVLNEALEF